MRVFGATVTGNEVTVLLVLGVAVIMVMVDCTVEPPTPLVEGSREIVGVVVITIVVLDITMTE